VGADGGQAGDDRGGQRPGKSKVDPARVDAAMAEAPSTLGEFLQALEDLGIGTVRKQGDDLPGVIEHDPVEVAGLKAGQTVDDPEQPAALITGAPDQEAVALRSASRAGAAVGS
jgi:hypothetical protein